jgi:hypothetical protein
VIAVTREVRSGQLGVATWWCAAILASLAIATTWVLGILSDPNRFDLFMYGRYSAPLMAPVSLVGLVVLLTGGAPPGGEPSRSLRDPARTAPEPTAQPVYRWGIGVLLGLIVANELITRPAMAGREGGQIMNFPGLLAWGWPSLGSASSPPGLGAGLLALAALGLAMWARRSVAPRPGPARPILVGLATLALVVGAAGQLRGVGPFSTGWRTACTLNDVVTRLDLDAISYDTRNENAIGYKMTAFCLAPAGLPRVDSSAQAPEGLVVARRDWPLAEQYGARMVVQDKQLGEALWVMPGPQQEELRDAGELVSP